MGAFVRGIFISAILAGSPVLAGAPAVQLQGAGATFPYPLYSKWFSEFQKAHPGVEVNYQSIGSGGGIRQLIEGTVEFGASDAPMTDEELARAAARSKVPIVHIPTVLGAVVLAYQVPGVTTALKLSPELIADLFLGRIQSWDDPRLAASNPGVKLPKLAVIPLYRSDGSGTTAIFTDYLCKVSPEFKKSVGAGKSVRWPAGLGGKGNEGVTGLLKQTPGSLGYVELVYAATNQLAVAQVKNAAGQWVTPSVQSVTAAAAAGLAAMPPDWRVSITDAPGKASYPIASYTYLLVQESGVPGGSTEKARVLHDMLVWALGPGQKLAAPLHYAPLPAALAAKVRARVAGLGTK